MIRFKKVLLVVVPVIFISVNLLYLSAIFPIYSGPPGYDQDPAYAYIFNGLLLLDGQAPWHVDHPGTPLQLLCAATILLTYKILNIFGSVGALNLIDSVLSNPEPYLYVTSCVLLMMNAGAIYYLGNKIRLLTKKYYLVFLCQLSCLAFSMISPRASYVAPEALLIFVTYLLLGFLAPVIFNSSRIPEFNKNISIRSIGILCGIGLAVKVTFFPMLGLLLLIADIKKISKVVIFALITFVLMLIPIYSNLDRMLGWLWRVASHSGIHGSGQSSVVDFFQLAQNLKLVMSWYGLLYFVFFCLIGYLTFALAVQMQRFFSKKVVTSPNDAIDWCVCVPFVIVLVVTVQTILVLKHPGAHYLVPVLPLAFVGFSWLLNRADQTIAKERSAINKFAIVGVAIIFSLYGTLPTLKQIFVMKAQRIEQNNALMIINKEVEQYPNALVICAFRCTTFQYAISMGLFFSPGLRSAPSVKNLLHNFYEYNFLVKEMIAPGVGSFKLDELPELLTRHSKVFLITPKNYPDLDVFKLEKVISTGVLTLYEITGLATSSGIKQSRDQTN